MFIFRLVSVCIFAEKQIDLFGEERELTRQAGHHNNLVLHRVRYLVPGGTAYLLVFPLVLCFLLFVRGRRSVAGEKYWVHYRQAGWR